MGVQLCHGYVNHNSSGLFTYIFLFGSQSLPGREKYIMSVSETTTPPTSENSLRRLLLDMRSNLMQHVQDCASNAMQDFVGDDVPSESSVELCDDHSNSRVSD